MSVDKGDVVCMAGFTAWQPNIQASFKPPKGRVAMFLLLGDADKKNPESFDPAQALNSIGWHREDGDLIESLTADLELAAGTLRRYETLHRAKNTEESTAKAEVNAKLAEQFEATIARVRGILGE